VGNEFVLRSARRGDEVLKQLQGWSDLLQELMDQPSGVEALVTLLRYYSEVAHVQPEVVRDAFIATLGPKAEESVTTAAQILEER
jgi:hypothetical protein